MSHESFAAVLGAITAVVGTAILWVTQLVYEHRRIRVDNTRKHIALAHKLMMALEAQRCYVVGIKQTISDYKSPRKSIEDIPSIYANHSSVPRIDIDSLDFMTIGAKNKNILPRLISIQQSFDQMIDTLNRSADERRFLHFAKSNPDTLIALSVCLQESMENLDTIISKLLSDYPNVQNLLEDGLRDSIHEFIPIYKSPAK